MALLPALIGAGAAIVGGALSDRSNRKVAEATNDRSAEIAAQERALQREFAQSGIRWRVEDAKAAGLHPLFALGGAGATYTPQPISLMTPDQSGLGRGLAEAGQNVSRAIQAQQTAAERQLQALQLGLLHAQVQKEFAIASYYRSEAARNRQTAIQASGIPEGTVTVGELGQVKVVPDEQISVRPEEKHVTAGEHGAWREYTIGTINGKEVRMLAPVNDEGWTEGLESLPIYMWPALYRANVEKYGKEWTSRMFKYFLGIDPDTPWIERVKPRRGASRKW